MEYLLTIIASASVTITLIMLLTYTYSKINIEILGVKRWIIGVLLYFAGVTILSVTNKSIALFTMPFSTSLTMIGFLIFIDGLHAFKDKSFSLRNNVIIICLAFILVIYFTFFELRENIVFLIPTVVLTYMSLKASIALYKNNTKKTLSFINVLFIILFVLSLTASINAFFPDSNYKNPYIVNAFGSYVIFGFVLVFMIITVYLNILVFDKILDYSHQQLTKFKKLFDNSPLAHAIVDGSNGIVLEFNDQFSKLIKYNHEEIVNQSIYNFLPKQKVSEFPKNNEILNYKHSIFTKLKEELRVITSTTIFEENPIPKILLTITNVTELIELQEQLLFWANHDFLTKLPNRKYLIEYISDRVKSEKHFAFVAVDLNKFKLVNDTFGHYYGDKTLEILAKRFSTNPNVLFCSRLGGDEFILLMDYSNPNVLNKQLLEILELIEKPFNINRKNIEISASIGYSLYPHHGDTFTELLKRADKNMYITKKER